MGTIDNFIGKLCFRCFNKDLVLDFKAGDIICRNCGEIVSDRFIDEGNEAINYADGDRKVHASRTSGMTDSFGCMQTVFVNGPETLRKSLEKAQQLSADKKEKNIIGNLGTVSEMCAKLNLIRPIQDAASDLFAKTISQSLVISKNKDPIVASCVYLACRMQGYPRTIEEVAKFTGVSGATISRMQGVIARALALPVGQAQVTPESLVNRIATQLQLSHAVASHARDMCAAITRYELFSASPQTVAAAALVWTCVLSNVSVDVSALCSAALVAYSSVKLHFGKLHPSVAIVAPKELLSKYNALPLRGAASSSSSFSSSGKGTKRTSASTSAGAVSAGGGMCRDWRSISDNLDKLLTQDGRTKVVETASATVSAPVPSRDVVALARVGESAARAAAQASDKEGTDASPPVSLSAVSSSESLASQSSTASSLSANLHFSQNSHTTSCSVESDGCGLSRNAKRKLCSSEFIKQQGSIFIPKKTVRR